MIRQLAWPDPLPRIQAAIAGVAVQSGAKDKKLSKGSNRGRENSPAVVVDQEQRCPCCNSLNTKFCYYNNYSLSQPRHLCKDCRRYWTKGGTLRSVPVGGGCRKNKRSTVVKDRPAYALACLLDLDDSTAKIVSNINNINSMDYKAEGHFIPDFSTLSLPNLPYGSSKCYTSALTLSQLQESMRLMTGEESSLSAFLNAEQEIGSPLYTSLLTSPFSSGISNVNPSSLNVRWNSPQDQGHPVMFNEAELMRPHACLLSSHAVALCGTLPVTPTLEDHVSVFGGSSPPTECSPVEIPYGSLTLQVRAEQHLDSRHHALIGGGRMNEKGDLTSPLSVAGQCVYPQNAPISLASGDEVEQWLHQVRQIYALPPGVTCMQHWLVQALP